MPTARKLPSGSWRCLAYSHSIPDYDADGALKKEKNGRPKLKRIYESFTSDDPTKFGKLEAEGMANEFLKDKKIRYTSRNLTLLEAIDKYIELKKSVLSASTVDGYNKIKKYAFQDIMTQKLKDINTNVLVVALSTECNRKTAQKGRDKTISPKTVRNEFGLLTATLNYFGISYDENLITLPQVPEPNVDLPEPEEIFNAIKGTDIELPVLLAMWLSLSASEKAGLTKSSSLLDGGKYIAVNDVILTINGAEVVKRTGKQPKRQRVLALPPYIRNLIDETDADRIVSMPQNTIYRKLKKYLAQAGVRPITYHQLRHVNASVMHMLNIADVYAQDRGGWKTNYVMKKTYTHSFSKERQAVDNKIDNYFDKIMQHEMQHENKKAP